MRASHSAVVDRPIVWPVLQQHLEDAAFSWLRRDEALWLPQMRRSQFARLDALLRAHLRGIALAGSRVVPAALAQLQRWETADEAFVSTYALACTDETLANAPQLESTLLENPDCVRGAAAGLHWAGCDAAFELMRRWLHSSQAGLRRAALPLALVHPRVRREAVVHSCLDDADPLLVARALRACGEWQLRAYENRVVAATSASAACVRLEAGYALRLWGLDVASATLVDDLAGVQLQTRRRILLSVAATASVSHLDAVAAALRDAGAARDAMWLQIFRGDAQAIARLAEALEGDLARLAAYGLEHVLGIDLEQQGLWESPDHAADLPLAPAGGQAHDDHAQDDHAVTDDVIADDGLSAREDVGLLPPRVDAVRACVTQRLALHGGERWLGGVALTALPQDMEHRVARMPQRSQLAWLRLQSGQSGALAALSTAPLSSGSR